MTTTTPSGSPTRRSLPGSRRTAGASRWPTPGRCSASSGTAASSRDVVDFVEVTAAANPQLKIWTIALVGALAAAGRLDDARKPFEELVTPAGVDLRDDSLYFMGVCFLVEVARALGDAERAAILRAALEPYAGRVAITGLGGVGIGPVRRYVGIAAHVAGDVDAAIAHLEEAVVESTRHGMRPFTARAHRDLAAAQRDRDAPGDAAAAAEHDAAADRDRR